MPDSLTPAPASRGRRHVLGAGMAAAALTGLGPLGAAQAPPAPVMAFPRAGGAHLDYQTEWWYLTGYANTGTMDAALGFQLTFFRSRVASTQAMQSSLAAKQLIFAHAAITDVQGKKLWHDQRIARWSGAPRGTHPADTAFASEHDTDIGLGDWSLQRSGGVYHARVSATDFSLYLQCSPTQGVLLQGDQGLSRKGPQTRHTSYYYSLPHLQVHGELVLKGTHYAAAPHSAAWLDHEWSQAVMDPNAVGWDWIGINLQDGSALTAFRLRDKAGAAVWDGGSFRAGDTHYGFSRGEVVFQALRHWRSPVSQAVYPVEWMVRTPADFYTVKAVIDNQELDSRASTGAIYWEGLCTVWDSQNRLAGRGYLEMTGYAAPLKL